MSVLAATRFAAHTGGLLVHDGCAHLRRRHKEIKAKNKPVSLKTTPRSLVKAKRSFATPKGKGKAVRKIEFLTDEMEAACSSAEASRKTRKTGSIVEGFIVKPTVVSPRAQAARGTAANPATIS